MFTIIVLGECVPPRRSLSRKRSTHGGVAAPLLMVAVGGLLLVFAMWWAYFKREPDVGHHRSLRKMLGWGYGHYFVFAAVAALGAGLGVAADTTHEVTALGTQAAAATVAVPVAVYLAALAVLHAVRGVGLLRQVVVAVAIAFVSVLAATWIGVAAALVVTSILVSVLIAINVVTVARQPA